MKHEGNNSHWGKPHLGCSCNHRHYGRGRQWAHFNISVVVWQKTALCYFLHQKYSLLKEKIMLSLLMLLSLQVFWAFHVENIRRHDGCTEWWRWLQLMFREAWRRLHGCLTSLLSRWLRENNWNVRSVWEWVFYSVTCNAYSQHYPQCLTLYSLFGCNHQRCDPYHI